MGVGAGSVDRWRCHEPVATAGCFPFAQGFATQGK